MGQPSPLARYIDDRLEERGEPVYDFTRRARISTSGFYKLLRGDYAAPQGPTLAKIAAALGMSPAELLAAAEAKHEPDLIKQAILERVPEMREAVEGAPRVFWASIIKYTWDRAIDTARDMAQLVAAHPVSASAEGGISAPGSELTTDKLGPDDQLALRKQALVALGAAY